MGFFFCLVEEREDRGDLGLADRMSQSGPLFYPWSLFIKPCWFYSPLSRVLSSSPGPLRMLVSNGTVIKRVGARTNHRACTKSRRWFFPPSRPLPPSLPPRVLFSLWKLSLGDPFPVTHVLLEKYLNVIITHCDCHLSAFKRRTSVVQYFAGWRLQLHAPYDYLRLMLFKVKFYEEVEEIHIATKGTHHMVPTTARIKTT